MAASVMADAIAVANGNGDRETLASHLLHALAAAVLDGRPSRAWSVLDSIAVEMPDALRALRRGRRCPDGAFPALSDEVTTVLRIASGMARATGEAAVATHHVLAALVELDHARALDEPGVSADLLLARGAAIEVADDLIEESRPVPIDLAAEVPAPPSPDDLSRRTTGRRSALFSRLVTIGLPTGRRSSTPLGRRRVKQYLLAWAVQQVTTYGSIPVIVQHAVVTGKWWELLLTLPFALGAAGAGISVQVLSRVLVALLAPPLVSVLALVNLAGVLGQTHLMVWFGRVEHGEPRSRSSALWRTYWKESQRLQAEVRSNGF
ncbi:hypothetical protein AB0C38_13700 [Amycolatopsis sp. NPDC048633]|uniref:hypothetical protein n=1 Tax=Amycolatopsis sp. NPDC048633 TaxID=3157095 RepID=UPI0034096D5C